MPIFIAEIEGRSIAAVTIGDARPKVRPISRRVVAKVSIEVPEAARADILVSPAKMPIARSTLVLSSSRK
jgi:hypothetical protein